jgi:hypothetical protein
MNMNRGYVGWSRSRRAAEAEDNGKLPLSRIGSGAFVKAAAKIAGVAERHHTSKYCNLTDYYDGRAVRAIARQLKATGLKADAALAATREKRVARMLSRCWAPSARSRYEVARREAQRLIAVARRFEADAAYDDYDAARAAEARFNARAVIRAALGRPHLAWDGAAEKTVYVPGAP